MLTVFNREKQKVAILSDLKDYVVRRKIKQGYVALAFSLYTEDANSKIIEDEFYVRTETENFIVKSISKQKTVNRYSCELNLEDLQNKMWADGFDNSKSDAVATAKLAIAGTGWTVWAQDGLDMTKRRLKTEGMDALNVIYKIVEKYGLEVQFKTKEKQVCLYNAIGADKGSYFTDELNLTTLNIDTDTNSFATRLYVRGKDGATFADLNGGKDYVENFSYSKKLKCALWSDHRYEDMALMLKDAKRKLEDLCKPKASYEIEVVDLSKLSPEYSFLDYSIGDSITLISTQKQFRDVQRIVELTEYPLDPEMNSAILANTQLTFEEVQERNELMADYMDGVINDNGTIDGSKVEGIDIPDFTIEDGSITADKLAVNSITTNKIQAGAITSDKIAAGAIDATKIQAGTITANSPIIDNAAIGSAQIANGAITNAHIKNGAIDNAKIDKLAVAAANIKDAAIGTAKIQDAAITVAKIQNAFVDSLVATQYEFIDIAGLVKGASTGEGLGNKFLANIREVDAIVQVVRCFENKDIIHVEGNIDPVRDIEIVNYELILSDLEIVEGRLSRIEKKAVTSNDKEALYEVALLKKLKEILSSGKMLRLETFDEKENKLIKTYNLICSKCGKEYQLDLKIRLYKKLCRKIFS